MSLPAAPLALPSGGRCVTYRGRVSSFRTPGRAGSAGQKLLTLHNASSAWGNVDLTRVTVDLKQTASRALTVLPPVVRLWKTGASPPTGGTALSSVPIDSGLTQSPAVTHRGDASADAVSSAGALTAALPTGQWFLQTFAPRLLGLQGVDGNNTIDLLPSSRLDALLTLRAGEGVTVFLDYGNANMNPITDQWLASLEWEETAYA